MQHNTNLDKTPAYHSNRRALIKFSLVLIALLIISDMTVIIQQHESSLKTTRNHIAQKLALASDFCVEALLKNDFVSIEHFLNSWAQNHKNIIALRATTENGFKLIDFKKVNTSKHSMSLQKITAYNGNPMLTLEVVEDLDHLYNNLYKRAITLIVTSSLTVAIFGILLWRSIYRNAIAPLQQEIKERVAVEKQLEKRTHALEISNQELEAFSYSVSHDLRSPLRAIDGYSAALLEDCSTQLDAQGKDYLQGIRRGAQNMAALIDDLLSLSQVTRHEISLQDVDMSKLMHEIAIVLRTEYADKKVDLIIDDDIHAKGDKNLLFIAMRNLMDNAWKYTNKKATASIHFGMQRQNNKLVYFLQDNGCGFDMAYQDKLFEPFRRLHRQDEFPGSGIGLAIVHRIIQRHGGRIWAESKPDQGATFYFTLC